MDETERTELLRRIAEILGIPVEAFRHPPAGPEADEVRALLDAFSKLDRQARRRVLGLAEIEARKARWIS